jgi:hypothetical protein
MAEAIPIVESDFQSDAPGNREQVNDRIGRSPKAPFTTIAFSNACRVRICPMRPPPTFPHFAILALSPTREYA